MSEHHVRVIDHHAFPALLRMLGRARRGSGGDEVAAVLDRSQAFAVALENLRDAESILLAHAAKTAGVSTLALSGGEKRGMGAMLLLGSFQQYLQLAGAMKEEHGSLGDLASSLKGALYRYRERSVTLSLPGGGEMVLGERTLVMGVLNVTPDSFSDGGVNLDIDRAVARGHEMVEEGADILDVGGESTRPGAAPVSAKDEQARILPVITRLAAEVKVPISVDTRRGATAREALKAGAAIVNDISSLSDPLTAGVVAKSGAPLILMHMRGTPETMQEHAEYRDVMREICTELAERIRRATDAGVEETQVIVDPGLGFAKTAEQSLEVVQRLGEMRSLGHPILLGPSRKSFLCAVRDAPPADRLHLTLGAVLAGIANGAQIVRVHDVAPARDAVLAFAAMCPGGGLTAR